MKFLHHMMQHRPKAVLFCLFLITVIIRLPQLCRPLSKHHELNVANLLISAEVWNTNGVGLYYGAPVHMYPGSANIFIDPHNRFPQLLHTGTYLSMGPLSYLLPWAFFKILHIPLSETGLRAFNLLLQLLSVFLFYVLAKQVFKNMYYRNDTHEKTHSLNQPYYFILATVLLLFSPAIMWFMGNAYCHEIMVLPLYLGALITGFKIIQNNYVYATKKYLLYSSCIALAVYTDWLGCATALVFFMQALSVKQCKQRLPFLLANAVAVSIPALLIAWQYSSAVGWHEYYTFFIEQLFNRRTPDGGVTYSVLDFVTYFITGYGTIVMVALLGIISSKVKWNRYIVILLLIPLLHYVIFRGFSNEHDYSVLKWAPWVIVCAVIYLPHLQKKVQYFTVGMMIGVGIFLYEYINPPGQQSFNGERYAWMKETGQRIATEAKANEYIFINTPTYFYQIGWYAKRNYKNVFNQADAQRWLSYQTGSKGIYFQLNEKHQLIQVVHLAK